MDEVSTGSQDLETISATAPAREVEAVVQSPTNMATVNIVAVDFSKMGALKMWEWKLQEKTAEVEIAGVENTEAKTYGKPLEQKIKKLHQLIITD